MNSPKKTVAVLIPCYNEALTIAQVVDDFKQALPEASIYVYNNNSSDKTAQIAQEHGAIVKDEPRQGKGYVVRQMLRDIDANCYLMVDGDNTYPASQARALIEPILNNSCDMTIGDRLSNSTYAQENKRAFHGFGNSLVCGLIHLLYGVKLNDVMTGYRAFSRPFAKTYPVLSPGFEIETEISIHAIDKAWRILEIPIQYQDRPEGSESKLSTFSDGFKVLKMIASLFKDYKPLGFFSILALVSFVIGLILGIPVIGDYLKTHLVMRFPTAFLAMGFVILAVLLLMCGLILDTVVKGNRRQWEIDVYQAYKEERE